MPSLLSEAGQNQAALARDNRGLFSGWQTVLEVLLIILAVWAYCAVFLDLGSGNRLPGNESEVFQVLDQALINALKTYHRFPLWNPWLRTGLPFAADPMLHSYNPLVFFPVYFWGVQDGFKIALFLSFLAGALGMWLLGRLLGMSLAVRLWVALMYAFAGQPAARFFQGQYLFVLGAAWIPWVILSLVVLFRSPRRLYIALAAMPLALLFFSGNVYYPFYMVIVVGLFTLAMLVGIRRRKPFVTVDRSRAIALLLVGLLALGLAAVQMLPLAQFFPRLGKSMDLAGVQTPRQIWLDYTSKDPTRPDAFQSLPAPEEFYAYIGLLPFLACLLLPLAFKQGARRMILFLLLVCGWVMLWISLDNMPWRDLFLRTPFLLQFRHLLRVLIFGSFAVILLAGLSLDAAWRLLAGLIRFQARDVAESVRVSLVRAGLFFLGAFMVIAVMDLFATNRPYLRTSPSDQALFRAAAWLRQRDPSDVYVRLNPNNTGHFELVANQLRFIDAWYHFADVHRFESVAGQRPVRAYPNYVLQRADQPPPEYPDPQLVQQIEGFNVFWLPHSLPFVFSVSESTLKQENQPGELRREDVFQQPWITTGPNTLEVIASGAAGERLVVLTTEYPGWQARVDGKAYALNNLDGFLAVDMLPGVHKYEFSFRPAPFYVGLLISLAALGMVIFIVIVDLRPFWLMVWLKWRSLPAWFKDLSWRLGALRSRWQGASLRRSTEAEYRNGALYPDTPLDLKDGHRVHLLVEIQAPASRLSAAALRWLWATLDLLNALQARLSLESWLFAGSLAVYLFTRLFRLVDFPIYFMADEAVQTLYARQLIAEGFRDRLGILFPVYVEAAGSRWTPLISMYVHALTNTLFGTSIFVTRATSALVSLMACIFVGLTLRDVFKQRFWWLGAMLLTVTPAWLLHSRTAFETVMTTAFYSGFLYFYLLYRTRSPRFIYPALVFGALTFYTYSNAQVIMAAAALLLLVSDFPYHLRQWRTLIGGLAVAAFLALPFIVFRLNQPEALGTHLRAVNSYWFTPLTLTEKLSIYSQKLFYGLSPQYWFFPNGQDLPRHRMPTMGHIRVEALPLVLIGLALCLRYFRSPAYRTILIAAIVTPAGAALLDIGIPRLLAFVVPASLMGVLGLEWLLQKLVRRLSYRGVALGTFLVFTLASLALLQNVLTQSPLWFRDYGLYGMQYGARQLFEEAIPEYLAQHPDAQLLISPNWANATDRFLEFYFSSEQRQRMRMDSIEGYLFKRLPLQGNEVFVMTATEYEKALASPKFTQVVTDKVLYYPDGSPGFLFVRLAYSEQADLIFAAEKEARKQLLSSQVELFGQVVQLQYSQIDMGEPKNMFDGDHFSLMRGLEANPFILEMYLEKPLAFSGIEADFGVADITLTVDLYEDVQGAPIRYVATLNGTDIDPMMRISFERPLSPARIRFEILNRATGETANIHIKEITLLP